MSVLVASLARNASKWIDRFFGCLDSLDYPRDKLHFAFLEGNSHDDTWNKLSKFRDTHGNVWLQNYDASNVADRFEKLALLRNKLVEEALKDEDYFFSVDSDLVMIPSETLKVLINHNVDIVAPYVFIEGKSQFYDTLAYRCKGKAFNHIFPYRPVFGGKKIAGMDKVIKGLMKKLRKMDASTRWSEEGRLEVLKYLSKFSDISYLSGLHSVLKGIDREHWKRNARQAAFNIVKYQPIFEVDSVGTCYLVKRQVYDAGIRYQGGESEQVSFCNNARAKGFRVWVDPSLAISHVDLATYGEKWH